MSNLKVGDIVARKSYGLDILFKVTDIKENGGEPIVTLKGIDYRIQADAPESDLIVQDNNRINESDLQFHRLIERKCKEVAASRSRYPIKKAYYRNTPKEDDRKFYRPGKVLHLDGDEQYLATCLEQYKKFGIEAIGIRVAEKDQPSQVLALLKEHRPDILVLTGHDGVLKKKNEKDNLDNYRNSKYFVSAVREARKYDSNIDGLIIFAGACQSMYNELINAGANFASSPYRVLIHALDPVLICREIAFARSDKLLEPSEVINTTITGLKGIGGVQSFGKHRYGYPAEPVNQ